MPHGAPADDRAKKLFRRLKEIGFSSCLISNNQEERVKMFNQEIRTNYIYNAHKPSTKNYEKAMKIMGTDKTNTFLSEINCLQMSGERKEQEYIIFL